MTKENKSAFHPARGLRNAHLQTLFPALFRPRLQLVTESERFGLEDGDFVECIWCQKPKKGDRKPIAVLFHGLAGSFASPYIQRATDALSKAGFGVVLMHFRGCSGTMNNLPRSYHSGDTADAKAWLKHVSTVYSQSPLFAVGYSLGGNMLLKLLGEYKDASPLTAAISVSAPMQLEICADKMNNGFSKLYQYHLLHQLRRQLLEKYQNFDMQSLLKLKQNDIQKLKTFRKFDDAYTAPIHGFKDAQTYYQESSARQYLQEIETPTLIIQALDDPFMTEKILPRKNQISSKITLEISPHGGHVGFVGGSIFKPKYWLETHIVDYFESFV